MRHVNRFRVWMVGVLVCMPAGMLPAADAPAGQQVVEIASAAFAKSFPATVAVPADYEATKAAGKKYPLLVLLHGAGGAHTDYAENFDLPALATQYGRIIVTPSTGPNSWWAEYPAGKNFSDTFVARELIAEMRAKFRVTDGGGHWITGLSMGGYGALSIGLAHPDVFSCVGGLSACILPSRWGGKLARTWGMNEAMGPRGGRKDLFTAAQIAELAKRTDLILSVICGRRDGLFDGPNRRAHAALKAAGVTHQWEDIEGRHNWEFWKANLPKQLEYFKQQEALQTDGPQK